MKKILVTGGAGYIGSAIVRDLCNKGFDVVVIDNLDKGKKELVDIRADFFQVDLKNKDELESVFENNNFDTVIHCAALKAVGESEREPNKYFENNISGTINLLFCIKKFDVKKIIFSSTACVYKENSVGVYSETDEIMSPNVYGFTKIICENLICEQARITGMNYVIFRYFNVAGDVGLNYVDPNAQNIFPIISEVLNGVRDKVLVFGNDYDTKDGTGVRDYIHLQDLVLAHNCALDFDGSEVFNLGTGSGTSVLELVKEFGDVNYEIAPRRDGDVACALANSSKAYRLLGWKAQCSLSDMVLSQKAIFKKN